MQIAKLSAVDLYNITQWEAASDPQTRGSLYDKMTDAAKSCADKKLRGQTSVMLAAPCARVTTEGQSFYATGSGVGTLFNNVPGFTELPNGYVWLKISDRSTRTGRNGKWQRIEEYQGATFWDPELYGQPAGTPPDDGDGVDGGNES